MSTKFEQKRIARQLAVQALYQWSINESSLYDLERQYSAYAREHYEAVDIQYFRLLLKGALEQIEHLDQMIAAKSKFKLARLSKVELAILRMSTFEISSQPDVPFRVVINEAVEIAKALGAEGSFRYINAMLDKLASEIRKSDS